MKKKVEITITFDDNNKGLLSVEEGIKNVIAGHKPAIDKDVQLTKQQELVNRMMVDSSIKLKVNFSDVEPAKNDLISDMTLASVVSILNSIKNMES